MNAVRYIRYKHSSVQVHVMVLLILLLYDTGVQQQQASSAACSMYVASGRYCTRWSIRSGEQYQVSATGQSESANR